MDIFSLEKVVQSKPSLEEIKNYLASPNFFELHQRDQRKEASQLIDKILEINTMNIENELLQIAMKAQPEGNMGTWGPHLYDGSQTWLGIQAETLQTSYAEFFDIVKILKKHNLKKVIDLGAAYGRLGLVLNNLYYQDPEAAFLGYEIVEERTNEANRIFEMLGYMNCRCLSEDITKSDFHLPQADAYFIYDFSNPPHIKALLEKFSQIFFKKNLFLITRGEGVCSLIQQKFPLFYSNFKPFHDNKWTIYSSFTEIL